MTGDSGIEKLQKSAVAVFGVGGVGSFVCEALARAGVGKLTIVDNDKVCPSNINRQLIALNSTLGKFKVDVMKARILDINPNAEVDARRCFVDGSTIDEFDFSAFDYVVDAVDCVTAKLLIIEKSKCANVPVISCMGAGNKLAAHFDICDISRTTVCPLARVMRKELKKKGIFDVAVVYSKDECVTRAAPQTEKQTDESVSASLDEALTRAKGVVRRQIPGSISFVPATAGLTAAGKVINDILNHKK